MHTKLIPVQHARVKRFGRMANGKFYRELVNTRRLKTIKIGARRYTTDEWCNECITKLATELVDAP